MALIRLNNQSLTAVSALPAGVGGKVLQVVQAVSSTTTDTTSSSYQNVAGLSLQITPSSISSKILVLCDLRIRAQSDDAITAGLQIVRDNTSIYEDEQFFNIGVNANVGVATHNSFSYLDSPSTTSATTYKLQLKRTSVSGTGYGVSINLFNGNKSSITLMEIAS